MPIFVVGVREVWIQSVAVEADTEEEAREAMLLCRPDLAGVKLNGQLEYSCDLDDDVQFVREADAEEIEEFKREQ